MIHPRNHQRLQVILLLSVVSTLLIARQTYGVTLLWQDFDSLPLTDTVDEGVFLPVGDPSGNPEADIWTDVPPAGWVDDDTGVPGHAQPPDNNGVYEWSGWSFVDRDWWVATAGDQRRSEFMHANGTIMVADPDEWDDAQHPGGPPNGPWYNTFIRTSSIPLTGIQANTVTLEFDTSWLPEFDNNYQQTANITVSYDGGPAIEILRWESDPGSINFQPDATNEYVTLGLNNPAGAQQMVLTFGLFDAGDDWWWALDNLHVAGDEGVPEPTTSALASVALLAAIAVRRTGRSRPFYLSCRKTQVASAF